MPHFDPVPRIAPSFSADGEVFGSTIDFADSASEADRRTPLPDFIHPLPTLVVAAQLTNAHSAPAGNVRESNPETAGAFLDSLAAAHLLVWWVG